VWFTRLMLRERNATPHFESGVVTWVGDEELARRGGGLTVRFRVNYDDGASHEHLLGEDVIELEDEDAAVQEVQTVSWQRFELKCVLSKARLVEPARGAACTHLACCNYDELCSLVGQTSRSRKPECPVAGCTKKLRVERDVKVDAKLAELLTAVPADTDAIELRRTHRGYQMRPLPPAPIAIDIAGRASERERKVGGKRKVADGNAMEDKKIAKRE